TTGLPGRCVAPPPVAVGPRSRPAVSRSRSGRSGAVAYHGGVTALPTDQVSKRVLLAAPRGYCAGVDRAVVTVEKALDLYGPPIYVRKQIVHNKHVVRTLEKRGAIFV